MLDSIFELVMRCAVRMEKGKRKRESGESGKGKRGERGGG
jgi:hypothetical protein